MEHLERSGGVEEEVPEELVVGVVLGIFTVVALTRPGGEEGGGGQGPHAPGKAGWGVHLLSSNHLTLVRRRGALGEAGTPWMVHWGR